MSPFARGGVKFLHKKGTPNIMPESVAGRAACLLSIQRKSFDAFTCWRNSTIRHEVRVTKGPLTPLALTAECAKSHVKSHSDRVAAERAFM